MENFLGGGDVCNNNDVCSCMAECPMRNMWYSRRSCKQASIRSTWPVAWLARLFLSRLSRVCVSDVYPRRLHGQREERRDWLQCDSNDARQRDITPGFRPVQVLLGYKQKTFLGGGTRCFNMFSPRRVDSGDPSRPTCLPFPMGQIDFQDKNV